MNSPYWFELAVVFALTTVGNIYLGHFEAGRPKWHRVVKMIIGGAVAVLVSAVAGRAWFFALFGLMLLAVLVIHGWWLPRLGINGWTAEPREKYYALRGWKLKDR
jgi:hypothetical protein